MILVTDFQCLMWPFKIWFRSENMETELSDHIGILKYFCKLAWTLIEG